MIAAAVLLFLRKPWALTHPQLWAEDGPIYLGAIDAWGAGGILVPHRGYLQLLPRLIAWVANLVADVAYAPAIYNGAAFLVAVGLFARIASARVQLPAKPWLILAFVLAAHTGDVWGNIANLHWLTSFFLIVQTFLARPNTPTQRIGDLLILAVMGLTGPFVVVFLPLLAWRWWRDRNADTLAALLTATACAAVQAYFIKTTGPRLAPPTHALNLELLFAVTGSRLVVWPLFGATVAASLPWPLLGAIGVGYIALLSGWALRRDARRPVRGQIVVAFVTIAGVCLWRMRPDTWAYPDLVNADRYFYIPRILLLWLLIWELDARPPGVAAAARTLALIGVTMQVLPFTAPTPPDYHWADYCDAIRRGEPARIPTLPEGYIFEYNGRPRSTKLRDSAVVPVNARPSNAGHLVNFSVRTRIADPGETITLGMAIGGANTRGAKPLAIRAVGPSLTPLGVGDALPNPALAVLSGPTELAANDDWATGHDAATLRALFARIGAFGFATDDSRDAAVSFSPELSSTVSYTIQVGANGGTGTVLAEIYDAALPGTFTRRTPRFVNFSVRKPLPSGDTLMVGFYIAGSKPQKILLRAVGPTLGQTFGVGDPLGDPKIELFGGDRRALIAANNDWGDDEKLRQTFTDVGAFELHRGTKDAALVVTLIPGSYSALVSGADGSSGSILVEIYEVP